MVTRGVRSYAVLRGNRRGMQMHNWKANRKGKSSRKTERKVTPAQLGKARTRAAKSSPPNKRGHTPVKLHNPPAQFNYKKKKTYLRGEKLFNAFGYKTFLQYGVD